MQQSWRQSVGSCWSWRWVRSGSWCCSGCSVSVEPRLYRSAPSHCPVAEVTPLWASSRSGMSALETCRPATGPEPERPGPASAPGPRPVSGRDGTAPGWPSGVRPEPCRRSRPSAPAAPGSPARRNPGWWPPGGAGCERRNSGSRLWWLREERWVTDENGLWTEHKDGATFSDNNHMFCFYAGFSFLFKLKALQSSKHDPVKAFFLLKTVILWAHETVHWS